MHGPPATVPATTILLLSFTLAAPRAGALRADESAGAGAPAVPRQGRVLFYRILGAASNAPLVPRTRTACAIDGEVKTSSTGMALSGFTEYPFRRGVISYTFAEGYAYFPRLVSSVPVDAGRISTGDILVDHVYEPDACVWGPTGRRFVQTFIAAGRELVSLTLLVATRPGLFRAELLEGGAGGARIGSVRTFRSGHSIEWGWCRWRAGEAPLVAGRTYAIAIRRSDGEPWRPYLHATGDAYAGGALTVDGRLVAGSDLGAWIVEEPPELTRALVPAADGDGWVFDADGVEFVPRSRNIRLADITLSPAIEKCRDVVARVWSTGPSPRLLAGPRRNLACNRPGTSRRGQLLFAPGELDVEPGARYRLEVFTVAQGGPIPAPGQTPTARHDIRAWLYGEPEPGASPAIANLAISYEGKADLRLRWTVSRPCRVTVELTRLSPRESRTIDVAPGVTEVVLPELWRGHDHDLRLVAHGSTGLEWRTPAYRIRPPGGPHPPPPPPPYPDHPPALVRLAPPRWPAPEPRPVRFRRRVAIVNPGFEDGLAGWSASPQGSAEALERTDGISPAAGRGMAGWSRVAGQRREQVFEENVLWQRAAVIPGHEYLLAARAHTSVAGGPRGDTRVRLCADPHGGEDLGERSGTQWYWTDGRWLRFEHRFRAVASTATIGIGFFRWRDLDRASAFADEVRLYDLGPVAEDAGAGSSRPPGDRGAAPPLVLDDAQTEAGDRVEAWLEAPAGFVVTGIGARAAADNVTTLRLRIQELRPGGNLGPPEELRGGWEPDAGLEASIDLPAGWIATGFGARVAPEWDVKTLALFGRPLRADGTLGEEREFRAGVEPRGGLERTVRLDAGRVLTGAGLRCHLNDIAGIRATSARPRRTATAAATAR